MRELLRIKLTLIVLCFGHRAVPLKLKHSLCFSLLSVGMKRRGEGGRRRWWGTENRRTWDVTQMASSQTTWTVWVQLKHRQHTKARQVTLTDIIVDYRTHTPTHRSKSCSASTSVIGIAALVSAGLNVAALDLQMNYFATCKPAWWLNLFHWGSCLCIWWKSFCCLVSGFSSFLNPLHLSSTSTELCCRAGYLYFLIVNTYYVFSIHISVCCAFPVF